MIEPVHCGSDSILKVRFLGHSVVAFKKECKDLGEQRQLLLLHQGGSNRVEDRLELGGDQVAQHHLADCLIVYCPPFMSTITFRIV